MMGVTVHVHDITALAKMARLLGSEINTKSRTIKGHQLAFARMGHEL